MEAAQRIRLIWIIEKTEKNPEFSNKIGIKNTSEYIAEKDSDAEPIKIGQFAKIIRDKGVPFGRNKIHSWLNNRGYTYRIKDKNFVKSEYIVKGLFEIRGYSLYITPEGVSYFTKRLLKEFNIEEW